MPDWTIPVDLPDEVRAWWEVILAQLRETGRLEAAQPIHVRLLAQSLYQYDWITQEINTRATQIDELYSESSVKRQVAPEIRAQATYLDQIRTLLKDLGLHEVQGDPIASLKRRLAERSAGVRSPDLN